MSFQNITWSVPIGAKGKFTGSCQRVGSNSTREQLRSGFLPENVYSNVTDSYRYNTAGMKYSTITQTQPSNLLLGWQYESISHPTDIDVLPGLAEKWRQSEFNAGVTIGEGRESLKMITESCIKLARSARNLRRGNLRGALTDLVKVPKTHKRLARERLDAKDLSGSWLALQYGWVPMYNDIYNFAEYLDFQEKVNVVRTSKQNTGRLTPYPNNASKAVLLRSQNRYSTHYKVVVSKDKPPSNYERLGLTDPLTIAWELVPFSFVADWFLPIGDVLAALHAVGHMPVKKCVKSQVSKRRYQAFAPKGAKYAGIWTLTNEIENREFHLVMKRTVTDTLPTAFSVLSQLPQTIRNRSQKEASIQRFASAAALVHQNLRRLM